MQKIFIFGAILLFHHTAHAQPLIIKGTIKCMNERANSTKGAENVVVVPAFVPSRATITGSRPPGYFEFNTGIPITQLQDKTVTVYALSHCNTCKELAKHVFISEDQDRPNSTDNKHYVTIKDWLLNAPCDKAELATRSADSLLGAIVKQPSLDMEKVSSATALTGAPAFLNFINSVAAVASAGAPTGNFSLKQIQPGKINYGQFLQASSMFQSANTGFNFSPSRDLSEAAIANPSAIAGSRKPTNISLLTNLKNNAKAAGFLKLNQNFSLGGGMLYTAQDEFRNAFFRSADNLQDTTRRSIDSLSIRVKEFAAFISPVMKINSKLSVAVTIKSLWQQIKIPGKLFIGDGGKTSTFTDSSASKQHFDVDISATYKINGAFQAGFNLMNLAGTKLYADVPVPGQKNIPLQKQRSAGLGLLYKWQRFNFGTDLLFTEEGFYDATLGVNYVPFNNALISAGMAVKQLSYSASFRIKYFRIAYINDNGWMVNDKRKGKSGILNGKIYGGFIFDLN